jgi:hypothetical protein
VNALGDAIKDWEQKSKEIRELRFYWMVGLALSVLGLLIYKRFNRWLGFTLLIAGFAEFIYWTSPTFLGASTREFDRLLINKLAYSLIALVLAMAVIRILNIFSEKRGPATS